MGDRDTERGRKRERVREREIERGGERERGCEINKKETTTETNKGRKENGSVK